MHNEDRDSSGKAAHGINMRLKAAAFESPIPQFVINAQHLIVAWNMALEAITGITAKEAIGTRRQWRAFYPEQRPCLADLLVDEQYEQILELYGEKCGRSKLVAGAYEASDFFPVLGKDGKWLHFTAAAIRNSEGNILGAVETLEDITERKKAEEALRESEQRYKAVVDNIEIGISLLNPNMEIVDVNKELKLCFPHVRPACGQICYEQYNAPPRSGPCSDCPCVLTLQDGEVHEVITETPAGSEVRNYRIVSSPIKDSQGRVASVIELTEDITERKRVEEAARKSEEKYRSLFEDSRDGVYCVLRDGEITDANASFLEMFGYTRDEMIGMDIHKLYADPSYRSTCQQELEKKGFVKGYEVNWRKKDGTAIDVVLTLSLYHGQDGSIAGYRGIARDVTQHKRAAETLRESEAKYRFLADHASDILWTTDLNMRTTYISPSVERVLGFTPEERMQQRGEDKLTAESLKKLRQKRSEILRLETEQGPDPYRYTVMELNFLHKNGSIVCMESSMRFIRDETGAPIGVHGLSRDITERKKAEQELRESRQRYMAVVDNIEIGIELLNPNMEIVEANRVVRKYFPEVRPGCGQKCYEQHNEPPRSEPCPYCPCLLTLQDGEVHEVITESPRGSEIRNYRLVTSPIKDSNGRITHIVKLSEDITDRKLAQEALDKANKEWERTFNAISDGVMVLDDQYGIIRANRAISDALGMPESELIGKLCFRVMHGENGPPSFCPHVQMLADGREHSVEMIEPRLERILDVRVSPIHDPKGQVTGSVHVVRDITERTRVERDLHRQVSLMESLLETIPAPVYFKNAENVYIGSNLAFAELIGLPIETVIGKTVFDVAPKEVAEIYRSKDEVLLKESGLQVYEGSVVRRDGTKRAVVFHKATFSGIDGGVAGLVGVIWDITERKKAEADLRESEERFRALFECAEECIYIKDHSLAYTHVNPAMCRILSLPASEIIGKRSQDLFGNELGRQITERETRVLHGESIETEQTKVVGNIHKTFYETLVPLKNREGETIGICCISRDVTHRKRLNVQPDVDVEDYSSKTMRDTLKNVLSAARTDSIVLLQGESGSGKDFVARWLHDHSKRAVGPFFGINCAALPKDLAESELFGHERGAFTGAAGMKKGLLELAEGGSILLNEVGELAPILQSKLLTFLDTRSFVRVGGNNPVQVNTRLIAATHRDLSAEVREGRFLEALFYRLNVIPISIPPLRERMADLPLLVEQILSKLALEMQLTELPRVTPRHIEILSQYHWPGNVRELHNVLERSLILWTGAEFNISAPLMVQSDPEWCYTVRYVPGKKLREITEDIEMSLCAEVLRRCDGNKLMAAQLLQISRDTLYRYIRKLKRKFKISTQDGWLVR